jgi:Bacterial RNA polymerase, alpha chain C terminal domain
MRVTARGWSRDMGEKALLTADLTFEAVTEDRPTKLYKGETYFKLNREVWEGDRGQRTVGYKVRVLAHADLNLNGSYLIQLELTRSEIDRLFYLANGDRGLPKLLEIFSTFKLVEDVGLPREQLARPTVEKTPEEVRPLVVAKEPEIPLLFYRKVDNLKLSERSTNCLRNDNIVYIGDLAQKTEEEMLRTPNVGRKSVNEIKEVLAEMGLRLGMDIANWPPENIEEFSKRFENEHRELTSKYRALTFFRPEEN